MRIKNVLLVMFVLFPSSHLYANEIDSLIDALSEGDANISFRYRFEIVDQDGFNQEANASTLRTRLNYTTKAFKGFTFFIEADNVMEILTDKYNSGAGNSPGNTQYPIIADPQGTEINQAWIKYVFNNNSSAKIGRQRIILDNQRFIGGVGWRQNEQTYDAISGSFGIAQSNLFLAYIDKVHRIFGDDVAAGNHNNSSLLINWSNQFENLNKLTIYYYDINNQDENTFSTSTLGAKFSGNNKAFNYGIEFASQSDAHNNLVNYRASYVRLDIGYTFNSTQLYTGFESLEGNENEEFAMFRTPLATLHAFNGWADQFLTTPQDGIEDLFIGVNGLTHGVKWKAEYHEFSAQNTNSEFGSEIDLSVEFQMNKRFSIFVKAAKYDAAYHSTDTSKFWLMLSSNFK